MKSLNYKIGALKRKFKTGKDDVEPGTFISKVNEIKQEKIINDKEQISKTKLGIMGLV